MPTSMRACRRCCQRIAAFARCTGRGGLCCLCLRSLVLNTLGGMDESRRCFRMVGGVLVERTVGEVLPALKTNREGVR